MTQRTRRWGLVFFLVFLLSIAAALFFGNQLIRRSPPVLPNFLAAEKGYGVTIDLTVYEDAELAQVLVAMQETGLTWLRQPVNWAGVEVEPGQPDWTNLDRVLRILDDHNRNASQPFKLLVVLQTSPDWARPPNSPITTPPSQMSLFGEFARNFAERYGQQIDFYQIWHEPNLSATWGDRFVDPAAYTGMLREAALNIHDVDASAIIVTGALATTLESGPLNQNEITYLDQLYQAKADEWFDIVAVSPLGLWTKPLAPPAFDQPNFRRVELLREVMLKHNDVDTPIWATAFGWVALPASWSGQPSPWSYDLPSVQVNRTREAIAYARANWPWLGPMLAVRWDSTGLAADDPARGFALTETPPMQQVFRQAAERELTATVGRYPAAHKTGHYDPGWRFATSRADIPLDAPRRLTLFFEGTRLDLELQRGLFRGYLWVTVDEQPANALPQDSNGRSYVVLYDPLREPATVTLARDLEAGRHTAVIEADGGWEQWVVNGWTVYSEPDMRLSYAGLAISGLLVVISGIGLVWLLGGHVEGIIRSVLGSIDTVIKVYDSAGHTVQILIPFVLGFMLYAVSGVAALLIMFLLAVSILLRPDIGLALVTFATFFYQIPVRLPVGNFSPVEIGLALTILGVMFRGIIIWSRAHYLNRDEKSQPATITSTGQNQISLPTLRAADYAALALVILALISTLMADNFAVSVREWRTVVVESVLFYFLVRLNLNFSPSSEISTGFSQWRLVDAFVAGAAVQALLALYFYFFTDRSIDAEGVHRALGLGYGSPNNLALVLGRAWPVLLAVSLLPGTGQVRRWLYGAGLVVTGVGLYLTYSKGALLLGVPAGLLVMLLLYLLHRSHVNWRKLAGAILGAILLLVLALIPLSQTARFRSTFDISDGSTAFFRIKLWQASLAMLRDHWPLGVGLDNFLYQYRTRYILPEAWQEPDLNHPHNLLLDFGTRLGIGGILLLLWFQIAYWRRAWWLYRRQFSPLLLGLMGSMAVFLAHGLVDNSYFLVDLAFAFFLNVGLLQTMKAGE